MHFGYGTYWIELREILILINCRKYQYTVVK